jgi:hypothetical protein
MMNSLRSALPLRFAFGLLLLLELALLGSYPTPARACWNGVLFECFDNIPTTWPWLEPVGGQARWRACTVIGGSTYCYPQIPQGYNYWGIQTDYYSTTMCLDRQSAWCMGRPPSNDPEYDNYSINLDTYMTYGPINLSNATAARCIFEMYNRSEVAHDSLYWGAANNYQLTAANMNVSDRHWGNMPGNEFQYKTMNLDSLWSYQGHNPVSMLGQLAVYLFWRFRSDNNTVTNLGAFVDNVVVAWDDGGMDIMANSIIYCREDSVEFDRPLLRDDTVRAAFHWYTCSGGVEDYPPFHVIGTYDDAVLLDTIITGVGPDSAVLLFTETFVVNISGHHEVRFVCDSLYEVAETNENNNARTDTFYIAPPNTPPTFVWVTPSTDTVTANAGAMLRWTATDPDEDALLNFYYDNDLVGCLGPQISGGDNILEHDGPDSLFWNTSSIPEGRISYPFVRVTDAGGDTCIYAPFPVRVTHLAAEDPTMSGIPSQFYLTQNYPNPFNPLTDLRYGVSQSGNVTLKVYDVLGREVTTLVNEALTPGRYVATFDGTHFSTGLYLYTLTTPEGSITRKMMFLK